MSKKRRIFISFFLFTLLSFCVTSLVFQIDSFWPFSPYKMYSHIRSGVVIYEFRLAYKAKPFETPLIKRKYFGPLDDYMKFSYIIYEQDRPFSPPRFNPKVYSSAVETLLSWNKNLAQDFPKATQLRLYRVFYKLEKTDYRTPDKQQLLYEINL